MTTFVYKRANDALKCARNLASLAEMVSEQNPCPKTAELARKIRIFESRMQFFVDFGDVGALTEAGSALSDAADLKTWDGAALDAPFATKEFAKMMKYYLDALQNTLSDKKR